MIPLEDSHLVLPPGYRVRYRFFLLPVRVAGQRRWCETMRVIQRLMREEVFADRDKYWVDVGLYDEVFPDLAKQPLYGIDE